MKDILKNIYGENYDIVVVLEDCLEPKGKRECKAYDKLIDSLNSKQKQLLDRYLHLYAERIFNSQHKRYIAGYKAGRFFSKIFDNIYNK